MLICFKNLMIRFEIILFLENFEQTSELINIKLMFDIIQFLV